MAHWASEAGRCACTGFARWARSFSWRRRRAHASVRCRSMRAPVCCRSTPARTARRRHFDRGPRRRRRCRPATPARSGAVQPSGRPTRRTDRRAARMDRGAGGSAVRASTVGSSRAPWTGRAASSLTSRHYDPVDFGSGPVSASGCQFLSSFTADGRHRWSRTVDRPIFALALGRDGTIAAAQEMSVFGGATGGPIVAVFDADGSVRWVRDFDTDTVLAIAIADDGSIVVLSQWTQYQTGHLYKLSPAGDFVGSASFNLEGNYQSATFAVSPAGETTLVLASSDGSYGFGGDLVIARFDAGLQRSWFKRFQSTAGLATLDVAVAPDGGVVVARVCRRRSSISALDRSHRRCRIVSACWRASMRAARCWRRGCSLSRRRTTSDRTGRWRCCHPMRCWSAATSPERWRSTARRRSTRAPARTSISRSRRSIRHCNHRHPALRQRRRHAIPRGLCGRARRRPAALGDIRSEAGPRLGPDARSGWHGRVHREGRSGRADRDEPAVGRRSFVAGRVHRAVAAANCLRRRERRTRRVRHPAVGVRRAAIRVPRPVLRGDLVRVLREPALRGRMVRLGPALLHLHESVLRLRKRCLRIREPDGVIPAHESAMQAGPAGNASTQTKRPSR